LWDYPDKFRGFGFIRFKDPRSVQLVLSRKHTIKGNLLDVKKAITREENEKHVNDELLRKIFLAHINSKLTECKRPSDTVDLYKYFKKFDDVESLNIKRDGGYGFLLFKSRMGPVKVFEAGEIHSVKGFKLECRKVLTRDNLRTQTVSSNGQVNAKAKLAKADDPHLKAVSALMDDPYDGEPEEFTRPRGSQLNASHLDNDCNRVLNDPKASVMDTTIASSKQSKRLKYSGQVFQFPYDETLDTSSKPNETYLQENSFLDRSQMPLKPDQPEAMYYGSILNDDTLSESKQANALVRHASEQGTRSEANQGTNLLSFGKQVLPKKPLEAHGRNASDEDDTLIWEGMEYSMGPIDTKALEEAVQKLNFNNQKGEVE
jgi:hypothetical protein